MTSITAAAPNRDTNGHLNAVLTVRSHRSRITTRWRSHTISADTRRLFATDLVNGGVPIHIGAALLGHLSLQTTRGYVAVFDDTVVSHYQRYLQKRRAMRPTAEYRDATAAEWAEFEEHFDRRKVELGNCTRPYGTPASTNTPASAARSSN